MSTSDVPPSDVPPAESVPPPPHVPPGDDGIGAPLPPPPPPPPPPGGGYGPPESPGGYAPPGAAGYSVGAAFRYGLDKFGQNAGGFVIGLLVYGAILLGIGLIFGVVGGITRQSTELSLFFGSPGLADNNSVLGFLHTIVRFVVQSLAIAGVTQAALKVADGRTIEWRDLLQFEQPGKVLITAVIVGVATSIGFILCFLPGVIVWFLTQFALVALLSERVEPMEAISRSVNFVTSNVGPLVLFSLAAFGVYLLGALLCGVGLLVAIPVAVLAQVFTWRFLRGEPIAA